MNDVGGVRCITYVNIVLITLIVMLLDYDFAVSEAQNRDEWSGRCHF
jgi:hypothetical protein